MCSSFTTIGDSGALVLNDRLEAVGLHLGTYEGYSVFNPIRAVKRVLGVSVVVR